MIFRSATLTYLMPSASDIETSVRRFEADWRAICRKPPVRGPLVAALYLSFLHPFIDGNGRLMRAFASAAPNDAIGALCNTIACFLQGRQRLWNFVLPLALDGDSQALWRHLEISIVNARTLRTAVGHLAEQYRDRVGLAGTDLHGPYDAAFVGAAFLDDRTFHFLVNRASPRVAAAMRDNYFPSVDAAGATQWINSGANAIADGLTGPLLRHT